MDDPRTWLTLARAPGLDSRHLARAEGQALPAAQLLRESRSSLAALGLGEAAVEALRNPNAAGLDADERWLAAGNRRLVTWGSPDYPPLLAAIPDAPLVLFVEGEAGALALPQLAIVGSRNPTAGGRSDAHEFARYLAAGGLTITSGLALGIDGAAHRGALKAGGRTIAVCGTGLDTVYPREHAALADEIATTGTLVSEFPPRAPPLPAHFPQRNRVISGLALGVLVVEAASRSGSLSTARHAGEQGREVFAIPGSIHNPLSRGCHQLIRTGAKLVESAADILEELKIPFTRQSLTSDERPGEAAPRLDKEYEILLDALGFDPTGVDAIVERTGLPADSVASMLLILELEGHIAPYPGGRYGRIQKKR